MNNLFEFVQDSPSNNWELVRNALFGQHGRKKLKEHLEAAGTDVEWIESQGTTDWDKGQGETEEIFVVAKLEAPGLSPRFWKIFGESGSYGEEQFFGFYEVKLGKPVRHEWKEV